MWLVPTIQRHARDVSPLRSVAASYAGGFLIGRVFRRLIKTAAIVAAVLLGGLAPTEIIHDQWNQVALVRSGDDVTVYLNGQVEIPTTAMPLRSGSKWSDGTWPLGGRTDHPTLNQRFAGNMDEVAKRDGVSGFLFVTNSMDPLPIICR